MHLHLFLSQDQKQQRKINTKPTQEIKIRSDLGAATLPLSSFSSQKWSQQAHVSCLLINRRFRRCVGGDNHLFLANKPTNIKRSGINRTMLFLFFKYPIDSTSKSHFKFHSKIYKGFCGGLLESKLGLSSCNRD